VCKSARLHLLENSVEDNVPGLGPFYSLLMQHRGLPAQRSRRAQEAVMPTELVLEILSLGTGGIVRGGRENCTGRHRAKQQYNCGSVLLHTSVNQVQSTSVVNHVHSCSRGAPIHYRSGPDNGADSRLAVQAQGPERCPRRHPRVL